MRIPLSFSPYRQRGGGTVSVPFQGLGTWSRERDKFVDCTRSVRVDENRMESGTVNHVADHFFLSENLGQHFDNPKVAHLVDRGSQPSTHLCF